VVKKKMANTISPNPITKGIQIGDATHHQDQSMLPASFSVANITNSSIGKLIPFDVFFSIF
jgi:hypothetical protein